MKQQLKVCYGISSKVNKLMHVFMLDFDGVELPDVLLYIKGIQNEYDFSDFYIIKSEHGYNAICLDMMPLSLIYSIGMAVESPADRAFFKAGFNRDYFTLRFDCDKKLLGIVKNDSVKYEKSLAHKLFLEWYFDINIPDSNFDENKTWYLVQYPSDKNGYHLVDKELPSYIQAVKI